MKLYDPMLGQFAATVDDMEGQRKAAENRLRIMTATEPDADGVMRGFSLAPDHPSVQMQQATIDLIKAAEKQAIKNLEKAMKHHPLGPWVQAQKGLGLKTVARLLAEIKDPYWKTQHVPDPDNPEKLLVAADGPRTVSQLWAYCGLHAVDGKAAKRRKGETANWKSMAKVRAYNCVDPIIKLKNNPDRGKYCDLFYATKDRLQGSVYTESYVGDKLHGKPIQAGDPVPPGHILARAKRAVMKELLKDLWIESKRIHEEGIGL